MNELAARPRTYLMCPPAHFAVEYVINPWMDTTADVSAATAMNQWSGLVDALRGLGHTVHTIEPEAGLPDMVFAANGSFTVDGRVYGAKFRYEQRQAESGAYEKWFRAQGWTFTTATETNEGEGDFVYLPSRELILGGYGFRTDARGVAEAAEVLGRPVVPLKLVDPRFYHLDTALASLTDDNIVYFPGAFSESSQAVLRQLFPSAVVASEEDALAFGLNLVSDGENVVLNTEADGLAAALEAAGFNTVRVELGELKKSGGSVKCCIAELRG